MGNEFFDYEKFNPNGDMEFYAFEKAPNSQFIYQMCGQLPEEYDGSKPTNEFDKTNRSVSSDKAHDQVQNSHPSESGSARGSARETKERKKTKSKRKSKSGGGDVSANLEMSKKDKNIEDDAKDVPSNQINLVLDTNQKQQDAKKPSVKVAEVDRSVSSKA